MGVKRPNQPWGTEKKHPWDDVVVGIWHPHYINIHKFYTYAATLQDFSWCWTVMCQPIRGRSGAAEYSALSEISTSSTRPILSVAVSGSGFGTNRSNGYAKIDCLWSFPSISIQKLH
ncbi:hypothetical protein RSOLAG1IB_11904 [Rhizoctonia solani AG-1 IB]|uniref:Uncharacterized protein n=1 Tax=Thanatephorus cucumeris (strain AG1-IB / isolate 7/3/14) TaxID=1108050 RepID=A0A0B7FJB6_THACB|nr:hypothetical protein RSOLAG1IB_11904 [Rhizoctonia solani AG-1 IB]